MIKDMSGSRNFFDINSDECRNIYPHVMKNAEEFFSCANLLEEQGHFGKAISLLILGTEEYIKSFFLFLEGKGFELRKIEGIKPLFSKHTSRHNILRDTYSVWMLIKDLYAIKRPFSKKKILKHFLDGLLNILPAMSNNEWWAQADNLKNRGLYADYREVLLLPSDLTLDDYQKARLFVDPIPREIEEFIVSINKMDDQQLNEFRKLLHESEIGNLIVESFTRKQ